MTGANAFGHDFLLAPKRISISQQTRHFFVSGLLQAALDITSTPSLAQFHPSMNLRKFRRVCVSFLTPCNARPERAFSTLSALSALSQPTTNITS